MNSFVRVSLLFSFIAALSLVGCGERKSPNTTLKDKALLKSFQSEYSDIQAELRQVQIRMPDPLYDKDGRITKIEVIPEDLSYYSGQRVETLKKLVTFLKSSISKYVGKKILKKKIVTEILTSSEKKALQQTLAEAREWIEHYQTVAELSLKPGFIHDEEYRKLAGPMIEDIKKATETLQKKLGVEFIQPLVEDDILFPDPVEYLFTEQAFVATEVAAIRRIIGFFDENDFSPSDAEGGSVLSILKKLKGRHAVTARNVFFEYDEEQISFAKSTLEKALEVKKALNKYQKELKAAAHRTLKKETGATVVVNADIGAPKVSYKISFSKRYPKEGELPQRQTAFNEHAKAVERFIVENEDRATNIAGLEINFINPGERGILEESIKQSKAWSDFYIEVENPPKTGGFLTFGQFVDDTIGPLYKEQSRVWKEARKAGILIPNYLPITSLEEGAEQPGLLFKRHFLLQTTEKFTGAGLDPIYCFLKKVNNRLLQPILLKSLKIHIDPFTILTYGTKESDRMREAFSIVEEKAYEAGISLEPCP